MASLYRQSIAVLIPKLKNLSSILEKAEKYADERKMSHEYMLNFRLVHDMRGLAYQVQSCCNTAKFLPARLALTPDTYFPDDETTFPQLHSRIASTISLLESIDAAALDAVAQKPVRMETRSMGTFAFETAEGYTADYAMANFYFHLGSAYCILRHLGVPLGAMDFLGREVFVKV